MYDTTSRTDEEMAELMTAIGKELLQVVKEYAEDDESALSVSAMMLKYSLSIMRGSLTDEETVHTLLHSIQTLDSNIPIIPSNKTLN